MIGGPDAFGAGGWQNTAVEKALPVDCEIKSLQVLGKGGLVLVMHASEMADGNLWQKKIAKLAVERLGPADEVGVVYYDFMHKWHIPLQQIAGNKAAILAQIDKMTPGDMPDFDPALQMAHKALIDPRKELATKHVIVISDGDPNYTPGLLAGIKKDKVTVTTVGVACHGANEDQKMTAIAKATGGRAYSVKDPRQLPAIYIKESRLVSPSFVHEKRFAPQVLFRSGRRGHATSRRGCAACRCRSRCSRRRSIACGCGTGASRATLRERHPLAGGRPLGADISAPPPPSPSGPGPAAPSLGAAPPEPEAGDYASRLLKAKKKALEERKKEDGR